MDHTTTSRAIEAIHEALSAIQELEDKLRRERDFAQSLLQAARAVILVLDPGGKIVTYNQYMEDLSGHPASEMIGQSWFDTFIPPEDRDRIRGVFASVLKEPSAFRGYVNPILTANDDLVFIEWSSALLYNGEVTGMVSVGIDVTERESLRRERQVLDARKYQFVANVGHELRTPLSLIKGYASLMLGGDADFSDLSDLNQQQRQVMALILHRVDELGHLIDDLLTAQELSDPTALEHVKGSTVCVVDIVKEIVTSFRPLAREKGLDMHCHCPAEGIAVNGSARMIGRAVTNLVMNAIKFTQAGEIVLTCVKGATQAIIEVSDTGIGIDPIHHEEIFDRFFQVNGSPTRTYGGSGIGLAVVRDIMDAHGGWVDVESSLGAGATFRLYFPLAEVSERPSEDQ